MIYELVSSKLKREREHHQRSLFTEFCVSICAPASINNDTHGTFPFSAAYDKAVSFVYCTSNQPQ